jgi:putative glutamine amidotransferase
MTIVRAARYNRRTDNLQKFSIPVMSSHKPLVGVISDRRIIDPHPFHAIGEKYLDAIVQGAGCYPVGIPVLGDGFDVLDLFGRVDGIFITGSPSNLEPGWYDGSPSRDGTWHDPDRDQVSMVLIPAAIRAGIPILAVCRGLQEMNVAFGGTLHQHVQELDGHLDHREDPEQPLSVQYGPAHEVSFEPGGLLAEITGTVSATVNSLHSQGVDVLGEGLDVEARAPDGLVEAFTVRSAAGFTLAVQWHPEWQVTGNSVSMSIFKAFGEACRRCAQ